MALESMPILLYALARFTTIEDGDGQLICETGQVSLVLNAPETKSVLFPMAYNPSERLRRSKSTTISTGPHRTET